MSMQGHKDQTGRKIIKKKRSLELERLGACAPRGVDDDSVLLGKVAAQQRLREARLELALHRALHRPRAVHRVVPLGLQKGREHARDP